MNAMILYIYAAGVIAMQLFHDGMLASALQTPSRAMTSSCTATVRRFASAHHRRSSSTTATTALALWKRDAYSPNNRYSKSNQWGEGDDEIWPDGQSGRNYDPPKYSGYGYENEGQDQQRQRQPQPRSYEDQRGTQQQPQRPFQRQNNDNDNDNAFRSRNSYSDPIPMNTQQQQSQYTWNDEKQRTYRKNKFSREPEWPQRQHREDIVRRLDNSQKKKSQFNGVDNDDMNNIGKGGGYDYDEFQGMNSNSKKFGGRQGQPGQGAVTQAQDQKKYTEDFRSRPTSFQRVSGNEIGSSDSQGTRFTSQRQNQSSTKFNQRASLDQRQQQAADIPPPGDYNLPRQSPPASAPRQGANIGDRYTTNFRKGSKSGGYNYRKDFGYGQIPGVGGTTTGNQQRLQSQSQKPPAQQQQQQVKYVERNSHFDEYDDRIMEDWDMADLGRSPPPTSGQRDNREQLNQQGRDQGRDFGRSAGGANYNYYNDPTATKQRGRPQSRGDGGRSSASGANYQYYDDPKLSPLPLPSPSTSKQPIKSQQQQSDSSSYRSGGDYSYTEPQAMPPPLEVDEYGFGSRVPKQEYGTSGRRSVDSRQPPSQPNDDLDWRERQNTFDQWRLEQEQQISTRSPPPTTRRQQETSDRRIPKDFKRTPTQQYESNRAQYDLPKRSSSKEKRYDQSFNFGNGGIKKMFDKLTSPYASYGGVFGVDRMMGQVNSEITKSMDQEQRLTKALLADARNYLLADPSVRNLLGDAITLGKPFSKSSSSNTVNGMTESRLRMEIPITGNRDTGRLQLVANQDEIELLELDVGGGVIDVRLDRDRGGSDDVIDASVLNRQVY